MKHQLTDSEKQAAKERRARFAGFCKQVAGMTDEQRAQLSNKMASLVTCEGHVLSLHNTILISLQMSAPTVVGGFWQWKSAGRKVRKGEHGLMIWIPKGEKKAVEAAPVEPTETSSADRPGFFMGTVFDISQTELAEVTA